jgi:hypothetical protein
MPSAEFGEGPFPCDRHEIAGGALVFLDIGRRDVVKIDLVQVHAHQLVAIDLPELVADQAVADPRPDPLHQQHPGQDVGDLLGRDVGAARHPPVAFLLGPVGEEPAQPVVGDFERHSTTPPHHHNPPAAPMQHVSRRLRP